ncbi:hypothetical protein [Herbaspirillum sp. YR522]|uniref:hypothetical protein n=1 Tax=Herbaspirillum sp. YR522 TaxID=1144342 RepID=UPI00026F8857|nr:hypothetical protein [Herbaspirillum sp. YR522]EJN03264.1 hypothetical protein PMI40_02813 [Herbaspirillum sp. YR522]
MAIQSLRRLFLQAKLRVSQLGAVNLLAALFWGLALSAWLWGVPYLRQQLGVQQAAIFDLRKSMQAPMYPVIATPAISEGDRLKAFYDSLGDTDYAEQQVKTIFSLAAASGLSLAQADYRMSEEKAGGFTAYRVRFPVRGSYKAVRQFCMQLLLAIPFASLDELQFKRTEVSSEVIEVNLQLTLYLARRGAGAAGGAAVPAVRQAGS